jgi:hypothetical protein
LVLKISDGNFTLEDSIFHCCFKLSVQYLCWIISLSRLILDVDARECSSNFIEIHSCKESLSKESGQFLVFLAEFQDCAHVIVGLSLGELGSGFGGTLGGFAKGLGNSLGIVGVLKHDCNFISGLLGGGSDGSQLLGCLGWGIFASKL